MLTPATAAMRFVVTAFTPSRFRILAAAPSTASTVLAGPALDRPPPDCTLYGLSVHFA
jgi:hypothetical protein